MKWLQALTPKRIQDLTPYASARRTAQAGDIWLNANENSATPGFDELPWALNRYPDFQPEMLLNAYAGYACISTEQLLVTRGIDEGIDLLISTFCEAGVDEIVYTPPTYGMYKIAAETRGVKARAISLTKEFQLGLERVETTIQADLVSGRPPKLIFLCSPNNPTGNLLKQSDVLKVLEASSEKSLILLDEAYIEFIPEASYVALLSKYANLVILRTLSKGFGLAGLRCGFVMANPAIIQLLRKVSAPYPIPVPVVSLAAQALSESGIAKMKTAVEAIIATRTLLEQQLTTFSFVRQIYPGQANFILIKVDDPGALISFLAGQGIIIRDQSFQPGLEKCVRISIGSPRETQSLLKALQEFEESK